MALSYQLARIVLGTGVDLSSDPFLVGSAKLTNADNVSFVRRGAVSKRYGHEAMHANALSWWGSVVDVASQGSRLWARDGRKLYEYSPATAGSDDDAWSDARAAAPLVDVWMEPSAPRLSVGSQQVQPSVAQAGNLRVYAWLEESPGALLPGETTGRYTLHDATTGAELYRSTFATYDVFCLVAAGDYIHLYTQEAGGPNMELHLRVFDSQVIDLGGNTITDAIADKGAIKTDLTAVGSGDGLDAAYNSVASKIVVAYGRLSGGTNYTGVFTVTPDGDTVSATTSTAATLGSSAMTVATDSLTGNVLVVWSEAAATYCAGFSSVLAALGAIQTLDAAVACTNLTAAFRDSGATCDVWGTVENATVWKTKVRRGSWSYAGGVASVSAMADAWRRAGLAGRAWASPALPGTQHQDWGSCSYVPVVTYDDGQEQVVVVQWDYSAHRLCARLPGYGSVQGTFSGLTVTGVPWWLPSLNVRARTAGGAADLCYLVDYDDACRQIMHAVVHTDLPSLITDGSTTHSVEALPEHLTAGRVLHSTHGALWRWDDAEWLEAGFLQAPVLDGSPTPSPGVGTLTSSATYGIVIRYAYIDARGDVTYSEGLTTSCALGAGDDTITITVRTLPPPLTRRTFAAAASWPTPGAVMVLAYVTEANPTTGADPIYYLATSAAVVSSTDTTTLTVLSVDATAEQDPYQGGLAVEPSAPEACRCLVASGGRLWTAGHADAPGVVRYSAVLRDGYAPEWSTLYQVRVPVDHDEPITALGTSGGSTLAVFTRRRIWLLSTAGGPDANGVGEFPAPELVSSDVGCVSQRSVAACPAGLVFQSARSISLLSGAQVVPIGADLGELDGSTECRASLVPEERAEVRLFFDGGVALVWNYELQLWARWRGVAAVSATHYDGRPVLGLATPALWRESRSYDDAGARVSMSVATGWIGLNTTAGSQRVRRVHLVGEHADATKLRVRVYTSRDANVGTASSTIEWERRVASSTDLWPFEVRGRLAAAAHRCSQIKVVIDDTQAATDETLANKALVLSELVLEVGVQPRTSQQRGSTKTLE